MRGKNIRPDRSLELTSLVFSAQRLARPPWLGRSCRIANRLEPRLSTVSAPTPSFTSPSQGLGSFLSARTPKCLQSRQMLGAEQVGSGDLELGLLTFCQADDF